MQVRETSWWGAWCCVSSLWQNAGEEVLMRCINFSFRGRNVSRGTTCLSQDKARWVLGYQDNDKQELRSFFSFWSSVRAVIYKRWVRLKIVCVLHFVRVIFFRRIAVINCHVSEYVNASRIARPVGFSGGLNSNATMLDCKSAVVQFLASTKKQQQNYRLSSYPSQWCAASPSDSIEDARPKAKRWRPKTPNCATACNVIGANLL